MRRFLMLAFALGLISTRASAQIPPGPADTQQSDSPRPRTSKSKCTPVRFSGEVTRDQKYTHSIPDSLEFRLLPSPEGWSIAIGRPGDRIDYVGIATPPYHGTNPVFIEAWHFRNADNTGPNEGQVNAPGNIRDFSFVLSRAQFKRFSDALDIWSGGEASATEKRRDAATKFLLDAPRQSGSLTITEMKLGGLEKGVRPWFASMKFNVDLCFPPPPPTAAKGSAANAPPPKKAP